MLLPWIVYTLLVTALIAVVAVAGEGVAKVLAFPTRVVWCVALIGVATVCLVSWHNPAAERSLNVLPAAIGGTPALPQLAEREGLQRDGSTVVARRAPSTNALFAAAWLGMSGLYALFLGVSAVQLRRRQRGWAHAQACGEDVLVSDGLGPAVVGIFRPVIALPTWAMKENAERLRLIVAHEREHLRAGDQRVLALAWIIAIVLPWNVVAWWLIARLRQAIEIDCDRRVMRDQRDVRAYGELLIEVSRRRSAFFPAGLTAFAERPSNVERRIMALTTGIPKHGKLTASILSLVVAAGVFAACEIPKPVGPGGRGTSALASVQSGRPTDMRAPLPAGAASAARGVIRRLPAVGATGTPDGQAVWFIANRDSTVIASWVGRVYSEAEFRRVARQPAYDTLRLVPFNADLKADNGAPVNVVWARDVIPWEIHEFISARTRDLMRDSIRVLQPALYSGLAPGQAIYFVLDWRARRVERIWAAPALSDRRAQWEYARGHFAERVELYATNVTVTTEDGRQIPVVYLKRTPWAERYGSDVQ